VVFEYRWCYLIWAEVIIFMNIQAHMTMIDLEHIKQRIRPILDKYGIRRAGIFGSIARGESVANDIDLLVKIDRKISLLEFIGIQQELEDELGMKVDLVEYDAIKPILRDEILSEEVSVI
jgi:predicted nucleotidyltransferase